MEAVFEEALGDGADAAEDGFVGELAEERADEPAGDGDDGGAAEGGGEDGGEGAAGDGVG